MLRIQDGHYGGVEVDGLDVVMTYSIGQWLRLYVDDKATDAQVEAVGKLLNQERTFGMLFATEKGVLSTEKSPVSVETRAAAAALPHRAGLRAAADRLRRRCNAAR